MQGLVSWILIVTVIGNPKHALAEPVAHSEGTASSGDEDQPFVFISATSPLEIFVIASKH
ncbi:MAG: hypothetical protein QM811_11075 [Pirellulales bacterium]